MANFQLKHFALGVLFAVGVMKVFQTFFPWKKKRHECLFFTPQQVTCNNNCYLGRTPCDREFYPCNACNSKKLLTMLEQAKSNLDICMYLVTYDEMCRLILNAFRRGIKVRIILDKHIAEDAFKVKNMLFHREYVPVKVVKCSGMMHNKFAIIDNETLMVGSVNWTRQAFTGNYENVLILKDKQIIQEYLKYFEVLWSTN